MEYKKIFYSFLNSRSGFPTTVDLLVFFWQQTIYHLGEE